jgi:hypothetical protein
MISANLLVYVVLFHDALSTDQAGSTGNASALYSGGVWFEFRPGHSSPDCGFS